MICPYCQHEIDVDTLECPRCFTPYPRAGMPFGFNLRKMLAASVMMLVFSLILVDCVFNYLPGGVDSTIPTGSSQLPIQPLPNTKSQEVNALLGRWAAGQQNTSTPPFNTRK